MKEIQYIPISNLILLENNPRIITKDQFSKLCKSLETDPDFFDRRPCLVNREGEEFTVYAGNQRVRAAKKLGWKEVPCIIDVCLDEKVMQKRIVADNLHNGNWDFDILGNEFDIDILLLAGFTENMLDGAFDPIENIEGEIPEKKSKKQKECPECGHCF